MIIICWSFKRGVASLPQKLLNESGFLSHGCFFLQKNIFAVFGVSEPPQIFSTLKSAFHGFESDSDSCRTAEISTREGECKFKRVHLLERCFWWEKKQVALIFRID